MKHTIAALRVSLFILLVVSASNTMGQAVRTGIFGRSGANARGDDDYGLFTIGTMFGITMDFEDRNTYKVVDGVVRYDRRSSASERLHPAVYGFPSIALGQLGKTGHKKTLSAIVPFSVSPASSLASGFGLSLGINTVKEAEVGLSAMLIWSQMTTLNDAQQKSLDTQTRLPEGESSDFPTKSSIGLGIGIYICPKLK